MPTSPLQRRIVYELLSLVLATCLYFLLIDSTFVIDVSAALFGLVMLGLNVRFTQDVVWAQFPLALSRAERLRGCVRAVLPVLLIAAGLCLVIGVMVGYADNGWPTVWKRLGNWHIVIAVGVYLPWALLQQTLCQFYLHGRLRTLFPPTIAVVCTGIVFGLVHFPNLWVMLLTTGMGMFWTALYARYRVLIPLAVSHAVLGAVFFYWIYGRDLALKWGKRVLELLW